MQVRLERRALRADAPAGLPVAMPGLLAKMSPRLGLQEACAWVFLAHEPIEESGKSRRVRCRMHEVNVQRAVRSAAGKAGIAVRVTPHVLRHSYATHAHSSGAPPCDLQEVLWNGKLETTMRYLRQSFGVQSPLDALAAG